MSRSIKRACFGLSAAVIATLAPLSLAEMALGAIVSPPSAEGDFAALWAGPIGVGGMVPGLDLRLVGGRAKTTGLGLRGAERPELIAIGDSFSCGYRLDQTQMWALRLGVPGAAALSSDPTYALARYEALRVGGLRPRIVLAGVCLGNDISGAWLHGLPAAERQAASLVELDPSLYTIQDFAPPPAFFPRLRARVFAEGANTPQAQGHNGPNGRHLLCDPTSGIGTHLAASPLEGAFDDVCDALASLDRRVCSDGARFLVVVFPQRYTVQAKDREATVRAYGLRESAFDWERPRRLVMAGLRARRVQAVDTTEPLRAAHLASGRSMYFSGGDMHLGPLGQDVTVAAVARALSGLK